MNAEPVKKATCKECGSPDLEAYAMCRVDTTEFVEWSTAGEDDEVYCNHCEEWTTCKFDNKVVQVHCPICGKDTWWDAEFTPYCKECNIDMIPSPIVEEEQ